MTQPNHLPELNSTYGAPMGRSSYGILENVAPGTLQILPVALTEGYDSGGAYWGVGVALWCATDNDGYCQFVRAHSRHDAIIILGIVNEYADLLSSDIDIPAILDAAKTGFTAAILFAPGAGEEVEGV